MKLSGVTLAVALAAIGQAQPGCAPTSPIRLTGKSCGQTQPLYLSCLVPKDIVSEANNPSTVQRSADIFSWQEFLALNWPAQEGKRGVPDARKPITAPGPRVWETWKESYEVFLPNGAAPAVWNTPQQNGCGTGKTLVRTQKIEDMGIDSTLQAAGSAPDPPPTLTDQAGHLVRYEIRMNEVMFNYIVANKLYNGTVQANFGPVDLPIGSMLIKAAWREVRTKEEEQRYYTVTACVCDGGVNEPPKNCRPLRMGLVGLHLNQRTESAPQWIWSTFEHVDDVPGAGASAPYAFFNPTCFNCLRNQQTKAGTPAQLSREIPIPSKDPDCERRDEPLDNVEHLNRDVSTALGSVGSIFNKYVLVNTQRPLPPTQPRPTTAFRATPAVLANTTMESYVQRTSSCIGCHSTARTTNPNAFATSHFTFVLNNAQPQPANTVVLSLPSSPTTPWQNQYWTEIQRGRDIISNTYERLPQNAKAKLHCVSCHLNGGANSTAAWWVELSYRYPTVPSIEGRINQCFLNSMNGAALCTPASGSNKGTCAGNTDMHAIMRYMEFLTEVFKSQSSPPTPTPHGFPAVKTLAGDYCRGEETFVQKCAVCHEREGQGRYPGGKYFRPALWGPNSFNQNAGMFSDPMMLAQFISWNMPWGAGGLVTDQEAWDLEAFIHAHARPGNPPSKLKFCRE